MLSVANFIKESKCDGGIKEAWFGIFFHSSSRLSSSRCSGSELFSILKIKLLSSIFSNSSDVANGDLSFAAWNSFIDDCYCTVFICSCTNRHTRWSSHWSFCFCHCNPINVYHFRVGIQKYSSPSHQTLAFLQDAGRVDYPGWGKVKIDNTCFSYTTIANMAWLI